MRFFKIIFLALIVLILSTKACWAYSAGGDITQWEKSVYDTRELNLESHTNETFKNLAGSISVAILGRTTGNESGQGNTEKSVLGGLSRTIIALYEPPVSSAEYFADLGKNLGLVKPAYAQGIGFSGFRNILPLWKAFRNVAYIFFVAIFLFTGLAIMFRVKIDPKTAVTIQNAIPKLIIALILVTFSYAIAGLLIDLIYVLIYLGVLVIAQTGWLANVAHEQQKFINLSFGEAYGLIFVGGARAVWEALYQTFFSSVETVWSDKAVAGTIGWIVGAVGGIVFLAIFAIITLWLVFKLFFALLLAYISIILLVVFAPLQILIGAIPGIQGGGFGSWLKSLLQNILVFPAVAIILLLGWVLAFHAGPTWSPPVIGVSGDALIPFISLGILIIASRIPATIKAAFEGKPFPYGTAIGEAFWNPATKFGAQWTANELDLRAKQAEEMGGPPLRWWERAGRAASQVGRLTGQIKK
ncbi:MAG TPA: hypothetical protein VMW25_01930 [Clostridia bacterium]|nr:hypothetical protein [Clostridia bacterium]